MGSVQAVQPIDPVLAVSGPLKAIGVRAQCIAEGWGFGAFPNQGAPRLGIPQRLPPVEEGI
ncbi:hypothetical protein B6U99_07000 [Candidatus Geothermarchaeota archaeon ex4572_27]|nr:MAG: hypothetical protein B6U99_07000 [Candidatus Geothermarchaeota archaeon ex4572_27]